MGVYEYVSVKKCTGEDTKYHTEKRLLYLTRTTVGNSRKIVRAERCSVTFKK